MAQLETSTAVVPRRKYACDRAGCSSSFECLSHLKRHHVTHTGERPFKCHHASCRASYRNNKDLVIHLRLHTGERPYVCQHPGCNFKGKAIIYLRRHEVTHTAVRRFACLHPGCGQSFQLGYRLTRHRRIHTGEKPYRCHFEGCARVFAYLEQLKGHISTQHEDGRCRAEKHLPHPHPPKKRQYNKTFSCTYPGCHFITKHSGSLTSHKFHHTGEKPYVCPVKACGKAFSNHNTITRHVKNAHSDCPAGSFGPLLRHSTKPSRWQRFSINSKDDRNSSETTENDLMSDYVNTINITDASDSDVPSITGDLQKGYSVRFADFNRSFPLPEELVPSYLTLILG
ncbi:putative Zinc finger protein 143 [Hypsibius exemplaris]|uniref:Zinc finger protein 143 n=1 Tax=Hypsibius exemplaris TaxID=2072580 RepID=A0A1W0WUX1_HYPEX|nr:putative Zinc finger protein 143 [Hypsibius exemplaris]